MNDEPRDPHGPGGALPAVPLTWPLRQTPELTAAGITATGITEAFRPRVELATAAAGAEVGFPRACLHLPDVDPGRPEFVRVALLCIAHPADGLRCRRCHNRHAAAIHTEADERTCDECGRTRDGVYPVSVMLGIAAMCADRLGRPRVLDMPVFVLGLGTCDRGGCRHAAARARR